MTDHVHHKTIAQPQPAAARTASSFLARNEFLIPLGLFVVFLAATLPGIAWGEWHPDEVAIRAIKALHGEWQIGEVNFDYPLLPQYVVYGLGRILLAYGYTDSEILVAARVLSAGMAGLTVVLTYFLARRAGAGILTAGLSGLFLLCVTELAHHGRFAHNDTYVIFFTTLSILMLVQYHNEGHRGWLYAAFFTVGLAASSKYIGGSLLLAPAAYFLFSQRKSFRGNLFSTAETIFIGGALTFLGYAAGSPKALFWMTYYFKRVFTALQWQIEYGHTPGSVRGLIGQYRVLFDGLGAMIFILFAAGFLWACYRVFQAWRNRSFRQGSRAGIFAVLLLALLALDLPMLVSYNYQFRYFLTVLPILAIFSAFLVERIYAWAVASGKPLYPNLIIAGVALIVLFSFARLASLALLFLNDARFSASDFIRTLPKGTSLEHTSYHPNIPSEHFEREHNYPVYFLRSINDEVPTSDRYKFNAGEAGLDERETDYFLVDSFTQSKFEDPYTCSINPVECSFFEQLAGGGSDHYKLIAEYSYRLPELLPQISVEYVNPAIRVYERIE